MQALRYEAFGEPSDVLRLVELPDPPLRSNDVRVRLTLAAIHNHDLWMVRGSYGQRPPLPALSGSEAVGVVNEVGSGVTSVRVGQRVAALGVPVWSDTFVLADKACVPVPDSLDDAAACQLVAMPLSAMMLLEDAKGQSGWLAQNAANGAVGKALAEMAPSYGVSVLNVVRRAAAVDELRAAGIGNAVATDTQGFRERARAVTGGAPIVRAIDSVGGDDSRRLMSVLADGGTLVTFGSMAQKPIQLDPGELIFKGKKVEGFWAITWKPDVDRRGLIAKIIGLAASGTLKLTVDETFALADFKNAFAAHDRPGRRGKIAFRP